MNSGGTPRDDNWTLRYSFYFINCLDIVFTLPAIRITRTVVKVRSLSSKFAWNDGRGTKWIGRPHPSLISLPSQSNSRMKKSFYASCLMRIDRSKRAAVWVPRAGRTAATAIISLQSEKLDRLMIAICPESSGRDCAHSHGRISISAADAL